MRTLPHLALCAWVLAACERGPTSVPNASLALCTEPPLWPVWGHDVENSRRSSLVAAAAPVVRWSRVLSPYLLKVSPVVDGCGRIAVPLFQGVALLGPDGDELWRIEDRAAVLDVALGAYRIFVSWGGDARALDVRSGASLWTTTPCGLGLGRIALDAAGNPHFGCHTSLFSVTPDGAPRWSIDLTLNWVLEAPALLGERIFVAQETDLSGVSAEGRLLWQQHILDAGLQHLSAPLVTESGEIWAADVQGGLTRLTPAGAVIERRLHRLQLLQLARTSREVVAATGTGLLGFDATGGEAWRVTFDATVEALVVDADDVLIAATHAKEVVAVKDGAIRWRVPVETVSTPVHLAIGAGGDVLVGTADGRLHCLGEGP